jgi:hypothetical protein
MNICVSLNVQFVELHGDRAGYDDPAIVTGIGTIDGRRYMFMGHQKGRNTKENIMRNFGMPTPHGYVQLYINIFQYTLKRDIDFSPTHYAIHLQSWIFSICHGLINVFF